MVLLVAVVLGAVAAGFGMGRVKNAKKLAAIDAELLKMESLAVSDAKTVINAVRSHL